MTSEGLYISEPLERGGWQKNSVGSSASEQFYHSHETEKMVIPVHLKQQLAAQNGGFI
jgi:hypothetical protein